MLYIPFLRLACVTTTTTSTPAIQHPTSPTYTGLAAITNGNRQTAVNAWVTNPTAATATYGHIKWWDMGDVTDMSYLFYGKSSFNDDITHW